MRIGIDIDGVLTDINAFLLENGHKFFKGKRFVANSNAYSLKKMYNCSEEDEEEFWNKYYLKYFFKAKCEKDAIDVIKSLRLRGFEIYIITGKNYVKNEALYKKILEFWLKKNKIEYDKLLVCSEDNIVCDKYYICKNNAIDIMFEDRIDQAYAIAGTCRVFLRERKYNKYYDKIEHVSGFKDFYYTLVDGKNKLSYYDEIPYSRFSFIRNYLKLQDISLECINLILNDKYEKFDSSSQILSILNDKKYLGILMVLDEGYTLNELYNFFDDKILIKEFQKNLEQKNLTIEIVKAFNKYSSGSNMILKRKRGISKGKILDQILDELTSRLKKYGFSSEKIILIKKYLITLDYSKPLYINYILMNNFLSNNNVLKKYIPVIQSSVRSLDMYYHLDEIISSLDQGLKHSLNNSIKLYRAVKKEYLMDQLSLDDDLSSLIGKCIEEKGYSSTSLTYDQSFAKYDDYDVVFDIFVPKGTQGFSITSFSNYGSEEEEFLMNANDLLIIDVNENYVDKNGNHKILIKALMISKDIQVYNNLSAQHNNDNSLLFKKLKR